MVDHYSDFWENNLLPDLLAKTTILRCKAQFAWHGIPERVISVDVGLRVRRSAHLQGSGGFEHIMSSLKHPKANGKAESAVKIVKSLCRTAAGAGEDPWKAILHWRKTPMEGMCCSPIQWLMSWRLRTLLPVADQLLAPKVMAEVPDKLWVKHQTAKMVYDRSAGDLSELNIGRQIRMKLLSEDWTGRWQRGICLQQAGPQHRGDHILSQSPSFTKMKLI